MAEKFDVAAAKKEAEKEIRDEKVKSAKERFKKQMRIVENSRQILANEERVLEELEQEIAAGL